MKNKNGMTLVEIILVIALLAVLGIIISINTVGMLNKEKDKTSKDAEKRITDACITYCNLSNYKNTNECEGTANIQIKKIYDEGLIDEADYNINTNRTLKITIDSDKVMTCK